MLPKHVLQNLAGSVTGKRLGAYFPLRRHLEIGKRVRNPRGQRFHVDVLSQFWDDDGFDLLTELGVVDADDRRLGNGGMKLEALLDLRRIDVLSAAQDEVVTAR